MRKRAGMQCRIVFYEKKEKDRFDPYDVSARFERGGGLWYIGINVGEAEWVWRKSFGQSRLFIA